MERYWVANGILASNECGGLVKYDDAQRALDAEREKVAKLEKIQAIDLKNNNEYREQLATLQAQLRRIAHVPVDGAGRDYYWEGRYWEGRDIAKEAIGETPSETYLSLKAQLRQVEGDRESLRGWNDLLRKERDNAVVRALRRLDEKDLVAKDLSTLRQLVEALLNTWVNGRKIHDGIPLTLRQQIDATLAALQPERGA